MDLISSAIFGVAINLASTIVQNYAQSLDNTLAGQALKKVGLNKPDQPTLQDELRQTLGETLFAFQKLGPQYKLDTLKGFFNEPLVGQYICDTILNHKGVAPPSLDEMLDRYFKKHGILSREFQANGGIPEKVFPDFFECYRQVLLQHVDIGEVAVLLAIYDGNSQVITAIQKSSLQQNDRFDALEKLIQEHIDVVQKQLSNVPPNPLLALPSQSAIQTSLLAKDNSQRSIPDIARNIHNMRSTREPIVLFLGAKASGLYNNSKLYTDTRADSTRSAEWDTLTDAEKFHESYRVLQTSTKSEVDTLLRSALQDAPLYRNEDIILTELIHDGYFDTVISTSIDVFLEHALSKEAGQSRFAYQLVKYGRESNDYIAQQPRTGTKVVKIFGDIQSSSFNTPKREFELDSRDTRELRSYLEKVLSRDVLMIGYDALWDAPIRNAFLPSGHNGMIYFANEKEPTGDPHMLSVIEKRGGSLIGTQGRFTVFIKALHEELRKREKGI